MASAPKVVDEGIDIDDLPEVVRIVEAVGESGEARALRLNGETLAILSPVTTGKNYGSGRVKTQEDYEAFLRAAGSWEGHLDVDKFLEEIYERRDNWSRTPIEP